MKKLEPLVMRDWTGGVNNSYNDFFVPKNSLRYAINMESDKLNSNLGSLTSRVGVTTYVDYTSYTSSARDILGLFSYDVNKIIFATQTTSGSVVNTLIYTGTGVPTNVGAAPFNWYFSGSNKIRFCQYLGYTFGCNGVYIKSWDGNTANNWGATNLTSAPVGQIIKEFQGKLYVTQNNTYPSRVYYSGFPVAGALPTWDTTNNYFDVSIDDGDEITAMEKLGNILYIFKRKSIHTWDGYSLSLLAQGIGSVNQEVVQIVNGKIFFVTLNTIKDLQCYVINSGTTPIKISDPVNGWFKGSMETALSIPSASFNRGDENFIAAFSDNNSYYINIGKIARKDLYTELNLDFCADIGSISSNKNMILKFNDKGSWNELSTETGRVYFSTQMLKTNGSIVTVLGIGNAVNNQGNAAASIWIWNDGNCNYKDTVSGGGSYQDIQFYLQTIKEDFGSPARIKRINKFCIYANGNFGVAGVKIRKDGENWKLLGGLKEKTTIFEPGISGYYFEICIFGKTDLLAVPYGKSGPFVFEGFEFFNVTIEDYPT